MCYISFSVMNSVVNLLLEKIHSVIIYILPFCPQKPQRRGRGEFQALKKTNLFRKRAKFRNFPCLENIHLFYLSNLFLLFSLNWLCCQFPSVCRWMFSISYGLSYKGNRKRPTVSISKNVYIFTFNPIIMQFIFLPTRFIYESFKKVTFFFWKKVL